MARRYIDDTDGAGGPEEGNSAGHSDFTVGAYGLVKKLFIFKRTFERLGRVRGMHDIIMASICRQKEF